MRSRGAASTKSATRSGFSQLPPVLLSPGFFNFCEGFSRELREPHAINAVAAYVLYRNDIIKETDVLDAKSLPKVRMPNRDNFIPAQPGWKPGEKRPFGYYP